MHFFLSNLDSHEFQELWTQYSSVYHWACYLYEWFHSVEFGPAFLWQYSVCTSINTHANNVLRWYKSYDAEIHAYIHLIDNGCTGLLWFVRNLSVLSSLDWSGRNTWECLLPCSSFMPGGTYWPEREPTCLSYSGNIKWQVPIQDTRYELYNLSIMDPKRHRDNTENFNLNKIIHIT